MNDKIKVKVNNGYLVATSYPYTEWSGITVYFETDGGDIIDLVSIENTAESGCDKIHTYVFGDVFDEDFTHKFVIKHDEIKKMLGSTEVEK